MLKVKPPIAGVVLTLVILLGPARHAVVEAAPNESMANLITEPIQYPPQPVNFKGKPAVEAIITAFGSGGYSFKVVPLPGMDRAATRGEITCNKGILVLNFDPRETYTGVLQSCPPNSKISIRLK
ncbi:MAG: hypothetical protein ORO03_00905 [Alphaproteobacteria bacterium]|nr:hypothetical protein [Alphaproteobacteria bacterium]